MACQPGFLRCSVEREATPFDNVVSGWITSIDFSGIHVFMRIANALGSGPAIVGATIVAIVWR
jgi:hypothetical protein